MSCAAAAFALGMLMGQEADDTQWPAALQALGPPIRPAPPAPYHVPRHAFRVSTSRELHGALARSRPTTVVVAPGSYTSRRPFLNPHGHRIYAQRRGRAVLHAGLSLGANAGGAGAVVRGLVLDISDPARTIDGAAISVWGAARDVRVLDTVLRGHGVTPSGISAHQPEGLVVRRVRVRRFTDFGIFVDANDLERGPLARRFRIQDADVAHVGRADPGSSNGRAEACAWIGNTGSVRRLRVRSCAWTGLWTGTATQRALVDGLDVDRTPTGVYLEHFTQDSTFRRLRIGPNVRVGITAEWADPAWDSRPASVGNTIELSSFESELVGVYLDEGTTRTTVSRSAFAHQSWAAIGDYRGNDNAYHSNSYGPGVTPLRHDHLSSAEEGGA